MNLFQSAADLSCFVLKYKIMAVAMFNFIFIRFYGITTCRTSNLVRVWNFVQVRTIATKLWTINGIQHEFIIFVHFGQMVYFRWQPSTLLQNFIHLRQSAAELLLFVQKSKMAADAILNYNSVMQDHTQSPFVPLKFPFKFCVDRVHTFEISRFKNFANLA